MSKKQTTIFTYFVILIIAFSTVFIFMANKESIPEPEPEPEPEPTPVNLTIIGKGMIEQGHRFFLEIKVNNTGDLSAYNTAITANVNFTTKYGGAVIYLKNDMGVLKNATVRGSLVVPVIHYGISEHIIPLEFLLGSIWTERPISYMSNPSEGYSFHILSDNINLLVSGT